MLYCFFCCRWWDAWVSMLPTRFTNRYGSARGRSPSPTSSLSESGRIRRFWVLQKFSYFGRIEMSRCAVSGFISFRKILRLADSPSTARYAVLFIHSFFHYITYSFFILLAFPFLTFLLLLILFFKKILLRTLVEKNKTKFSTKGIYVYT